MAKQILTKIKDEMERMKASRDTGDVKIYIPWGKRNDGFSVECARMDEDSVILDEENNVVDDSSGEVVGFSVYYQRDGEDFDCCTLTSFLDEKDMKDLKEFIDMYR